MLRFMNARVRYAEHRPYVLPERLEELTGPTGGTVSLPVHLDWSGGRRTYDLEDSAELCVLYERVIREALTVEDLGRYLDAKTLSRVWQHLYLPARVRQEWERRFPPLAHTAA